MRPNIKQHHSRTYKIYSSSLIFGDNQPLKFREGFLFISNKNLVVGNYVIIALTKTYKQYNLISDWFFKENGGDRIWKYDLSFLNINEVNFKRGMWQWKKSKGAVLKIKKSQVLKSR